jgi:predicted transcriptional regulator
MKATIKSNGDIELEGLTIDEVQTLRQSFTGFDHEPSGVPGDPKSREAIDEQQMQQEIKPMIVAAVKRGWGGARKRRTEGKLRRYTPDEDATIRAAYNAVPAGQFIPRKVLKRLAKELGRTRKAITNRAIDLGATRVHKEEDGIEHLSKRGRRILRYVQRRDKKAAKKIARKKTTRREKVKATKTKNLRQRPWTTGDDNEAQAIYETHGGRPNNKTVTKLAHLLGRTRLAVIGRAYAHGWVRKLEAEPTQEPKAMIRPHPLKTVAPDEMRRRLAAKSITANTIYDLKTPPPTEEVSVPSDFPALKTLGDDYFNGLFEMNVRYMIANNGRLVYEADADNLGLKNTVEWFGFAEEFALKSGLLSTYFGVPNKFHFGTDANHRPWITYGG